MGIGFLEIVVIGVVVLVLFGPSKMPEIMRQVAKYYVQFRRASNEFKSTFDHIIQDAENSLRREEIQRLQDLMKSEVREIDALTRNAINQQAHDHQLTIEHQSQDHQAPAPTPAATMPQAGLVAPSAEVEESAILHLPTTAPAPRARQPFGWDHAETPLSHETTDHSTDHSMGPSKKAEL
jgi:sec-independent protein translocase protein TatB